MYRILLSISLLVLLSDKVECQAGAVKFDEFISQETAGYMFEDEPTFKERLARFIKRLNIEPRGTVAYLVHYRARVSKSSAMLAASRARTADYEIPSRTKLEYDDVVVIDGGVRDEDTLEFWIGKRGGSPPKLTPKYAASEAVTCPTVWLNAQGDNVDPGEPVIFSVYLRPEYSGSFKWKISSGRILEGQGTDRIKVDARDFKNISVSVIAEDISSECPREYREAFEMGRRPILVDEFGRLPESDLRSRFDVFMTQLSNEPTYSGYVIVYGRRTQPISLLAAERLLRNHIMFRNFDANRITITKGGYRESGGMEIWLLPPEVKVPEPKPTVDPKFVAEPAKRAPKRRPR